MTNEKNDEVYFLASDEEDQPACSTNNRLWMKIERGGVTYGCLDGSVEIELSRDAYRDALETLRVSRLWALQGSLHEILDNMKLARGLEAWALIQIQKWERGS